MTITTETPEARKKKLAMRAARRGMKEMDIVLGPFAATRLAAMTTTEIDIFDRLLWENDQDILPWILGQKTPPQDYAALIAEIAVFAQESLSNP
ncbi:MAG: succinate dehydrogenase assembly factor 2 [Pseudorhodobacter sp.]